jgi:Fe-S oxidoreductase
MCPSFRVTGNERDVTRGRANALRLAISGQLGPDAFASQEMLETMKLCVSCKGCRRECPTGVDMAKMKIEVLAAANKQHRLSLRDRLIAYLPRYAPYAARCAPLINAGNAIPGAARFIERLTGFSSKRPLPRWHPRPFRLRHDTDASRNERGARAAVGGDRDVALFADTFNTYFEPENLDAGVEVLRRLGYGVRLLAADGPVGDGGGRASLPRSTRPLCCGRTFLSAGLVEDARAEARRVLAAAKPLIDRGTAIVGLEPSCLLTLRDEFVSLLPGADAERLASHALLLEEFLAREVGAGRVAGPIAAREGRLLLHGHCHQKAFGVMGAVQQTLALVHGLKVETVASSCCGMAGAFGYAAETHDVSLAMGELSLLPALRQAPPQALIAADGFSCRHQIRDGTGRTALHVARVLRDAMRAGA